MTEIVAEISQHARQLTAREPALGRVGAPVDRELRDARGQRGAARAARPTSARSSRASPTSTRSRRRPSGKIEIEMLDDGRDSQVLDRIIKSAVLEVFRARVKPELLGPIVSSFEDGVGGAHGRGRARRPSTRSSLDAVDGLKPLLANLGSASRRRRRRPASSSCSKACTSPSASTRTRSAAGRRTAPGADPGGRGTTVGSMTSRFKYSRWDGTQVGFDLDADALLEEMTDDLLYHGDLNAALRRMMQQGFRDREGRDVSGMREMLEKLRERRREQLDRYDLGGVYEDIARQLDEIVDQEREGIDRRRRRSPRVGRQAPRGAARGPRAAAAPGPRAAPARSRGPRQRAPAVRLDGRRGAPALRGVDGGAEEAARSTRCSTSSSRACRRCRPSSSQRMKDMLAELNQMLEQRERGDEPDFAGLHGSLRRLLPRQPADARRAARADGAVDGADAAAAQLDESRAARAAPGAGQCAARRHGPALADGPARPEPAQRLPADGLGPADATSAATSRSRSQGMGSLLDQLGDIDALENLMRNATNPGQLAEVDLDRVRDLLGDDAARSLQQLSELARMLEEAGLIEQREGRMELTPKGIRRIGQRALGDLFQPPAPGPRRPPRDRARRLRPRALERSQDLRVRRPAPPRRRAHAEERDHARRFGHAGSHHARGLRDRAHRAGHTRGDRVDARRLALDGDARPVPRGQEGRDGAARADQLAVPARLPRAW